MKQLKTEMNMQNSKPIKKRISTKVKCYRFEKIGCFIIAVVLSYRCHEALSYFFSNVLLYCITDERICSIDDVPMCRFADLFSSIYVVSMKQGNKHVNQSFSGGLQKLNNK